MNDPFIYMWPAIVTIVTIVTAVITGTVTRVPPYGGKPPRVTVGEPKPSYGAYELKSPLWHDLHLFVVKQRDGRMGTVRLSVDLPTQRVAAWQRPGSGTEVSA